ncbi:MAG: hypothetical protein IT546_06215 [Caulobacteraceae bacterium]|jgi:hypothetical protein|nr:hypothetical protein [Caulobacteraceae bacterium]
MTILRFTVATALAALALSACGKKDEAQPGAVPPRTEAAPATGPLAAADWPQPSPGLWENKVTVDTSDQGTTSRICYDAAFAKRVGVMGRQTSAEMNCQNTLNRQADGSLAFTATCTGPDGKPSLTKGVIRGDFAKAYTIEIVSSEDPDGGPAKISATRLGDCPADYKPGDMEVAGVRMNLGSAMAGANAPPSAPAP